MKWFTKSLTMIGILGLGFASAVLINGRGRDDQSETDVVSYGEPALLGGGSELQLRGVRDNLDPSSQAIALLAQPQGNPAEEIPIGERGHTTIVEGQAPTTVETTDTDDESVSGDPPSDQPTRDPIEQIGNAELSNADLRGNHQVSETDIGTTIDRPGLQPRHVELPQDNKRAAQDDSWLEERQTGPDTSQVRGRADIHFAKSLSSDEARYDARTPSPDDPPFRARRPPRHKLDRHTIVQGDSLKSIAQTYLGSEELYLEIYEANRRLLTRPDILPVGLEISIPKHVDRR